MKRGELNRFNPPDNAVGWFVFSVVLLIVIFMVIV